MKHPAYVDADSGCIFDNHEEMLADLQKLVGQPILVTFEPKKQSRSAAQLRWWRGVALPRIADKCGYDRHEHDRLHDDLLSVRFGTVAVPNLLPEAPPRIIPKRRTSDLNVAEMSDLMEWVCRYAAEHLDVVVPLPDDPDD